MAVTGNEYHVQNEVWTSWHDSGTTSSTADTIWGNWTSYDAGTTSDGTSIDNELVWYYWTQEETNGRPQDVEITVDHQDRIWYNWQTTTVSSTSYTDNNIISIGSTPAEVRKTKKQRRIEKRKAIVQKKRAKKVHRKNATREEVKRRAAIASESKARELLEDLIGEEQMKVYRETGRLLVHGEKFDWLITNYHFGEKRKQTYFDYTRNVKIQRVEKDKIVDLCVAHHSDEDKRRIPVTDQVIGFLLHAKHAEDYLHKTANSRQQRLKEPLPQKYAVA
jgi:hypothetical protein